jgi:hypothetical protein
MKAMVIAAGLFLVACSGKDSSPPTDTGPDDSPAEIELSVDELLFEAQAVGTTESKSITVKNVGRTELHIDDVQVSVPFQSTFSNRITLQGGGATVITVMFAPTAHGHFEEVLSILSTDAARPSVSVTCTGETITDADGDGFDAGFAPGQDCDDTNPNINPAAEEVWYNGINNNCICENPDNTRCSDYDQDLDGYDHPAGGNDDPETWGGDCNDANPDIHPGAADAWYDGYDTNCDFANDNDQDRDGYSSAEHTEAGTDCDDLDPEINAAGTEVYNDKDDDCDGDVDVPILGENTPVVIVGDSAEDGFGRGLTSGILDEDFASEVIAGAPKYDLDNTGAITVFLGGAFPATKSVGTDTADAMIVGAVQDELGGEIAYLESFGAKGEIHLAVGATNYGSDKGYAAVLLGSQVLASSTLEEATVLRIEGTVSGANVGQGLSNDLDLDGDGYTDLMGSAKSGSSISLWLIGGDTTLTGTYTTTDADAQFAVTGTDTTMLRSFPTGGNDFDGDGYEDFLFCNGAGGESGYGEVWMLWGDSTPYSNSEVEDLDAVGTTIATGTSTSDLGLICGSAGDWTGDGNAEVWIYSQSDTDFYLLAGDATLRDGAVDVTTEFLALYPFDEFTNDPVELRDVGDLNDTPGHEMAVGISAELPWPSITPGQMFVLGPELGFGVLSDSVENLTQAAFWGNKDLEAANYGETISGRAADVTGGGGTYRTDIVAADPGYMSNAGAVYVYANFNE